MTKGKEVVASGDNSPSILISQALAGGADLDKLQGLLDLQKNWEANEAKKAYVIAMAEFKVNPPTIIRDKTNTQYDSRYSSLENFVNAVIPALSKNGLSHSWDINQTDGIKVSCTITHSKGHSESTSMKAPADTSGSKNPIQQIKSTVTYLKLATFEAITGLASKDGNLDDDGNGAGSKAIDDEQYTIIHAMLSDNELLEDAAYITRMCEYLKIGSIKDLSSLPAKDFMKAKTAIESAVNSRKNR